MPPVAGQRSCSADHPNSVQLRSVRTLWLPVAENENYLLLEDEETGDVLLPLIYMKSVFEANYSRKLSSLKHRLVVLPPSDVIGNNSSPESFSGVKRKGTLDGDSSRGFVYWQWAFESPHEVKVLVRQALGEENTPQGHLRLILLPIVYNAMAQKQKLRATPFFRALHRALRASNYFVLLKLPPNVESELAEVDKANLTLSIGGAEHQQGRVFKGPFDLAKTLAKYTLSYEAAEDSDISKRRCVSSFNGLPSGNNATSPMSSLPGVSRSPLSPSDEMEENSIAFLRRQNEEICSEVKLLRTECEQNMNSIYLELFNMRRWMMEVAEKVLQRDFRPGTG